MCPVHDDVFCARTDVLLRMLHGDLARYCSEHVKSEIRQLLHSLDAPLEPSGDEAPEGLD